MSGGVVGRCPYCDKENPGDARFCNHCGKEIGAPTGSKPTELPADQQTMKCPRCSHPNPTYAVYCGMCGWDLQEAYSGMQERGVSPSRRPSMMTCGSCGKEISSQSYRCAFCGARPSGESASRWEQVYSTSHAYEQSYPGPDLKPQSSLPVVGGVMAIIAGLLSLLQGLFYMSGYAVISATPGSGLLCLCGGLDAVFGLASIFGGIFALQRQSWTLALVGAILGMIGFGLLLGFIFGLIAVIFIAVSQEEFS